MKVLHECRKKKKSLFIIWQRKEKYSGMRWQLNKILKVGDIWPHYISTWLQKFSLENINLLKIANFCHLHYNKKIIHIYKNFPYYVFCCSLRENVHGDALYCPLCFLEILYYSLAQGTFTDDLELHLEAFEIHLNKTWFCTSMLNQISQGLHPSFSISCSSSIERINSTHRWPDLCTIFLHIYLYENIKSIYLIFSWENWITSMFTFNGVMFKKTWPRNSRIFTRLK